MFARQPILVGKQFKDKKVNKHYYKIISITITFISLHRSIFPCGDHNWSLEQNVMINVNIYFVIYQ